MNKTLLLLFSVLFIYSCSPRVVTKVNKTYEPIDWDKKINVFGINDGIPENAEEIGTIQIGDNGFSTNCDYETVISKAKLEARKIGGNAIKITKHVPPSMMGSSCHRISAIILRVSSYDSLKPEVKADTSIKKADYALLCIYRFSGIGAAVGYNLFLGDSIICRVKNNWKTTIKVSKTGTYKLWAKTEVVEELPIYIETGNVYYIRCGIKMGVAVGRPVIELIDTHNGKAEFESIKEKNYNNIY